MINEDTIDEDTINSVSKKVLFSIFIETTSIRLKFLIFFHILLVAGSFVVCEEAGVYNFEYIYLSSLSLVSAPSFLFALLVVDWKPLVYKKSCFSVPHLTASSLLLAGEVLFLIFRLDSPFSSTGALYAFLCHTLSLLMNLYCLYIIRRIVSFK